MIDLKARYYFLPILSYCRGDCSYCFAIGCLIEHDKDFDDIKLSITKARSGGYQAVVLPCNFFLSELQNKIISLLEENHLQIVLQVNQKQVVDEVFFANLEGLCAKHEIRLNYVLDRVDLTELEIIQRIEQLDPNFYLTIVGHCGCEFEFLVAGLPKSYYSKLFWYFPPKQQWDDIFLAPDLIHFKIQKIKQIDPTLTFNPPPGLDLFIPEIPFDFELECLPNILYKKEFPPFSPKISIIIPSLTEPNILLRTLFFLNKQDFSKSDFEVIVVDSRPDEKCLDETIGFSERIASEMNLKFLSLGLKENFPLHTAGIARNIGTKVSKGEILLFLDADIILPSNYLATIMDKHQKFDVLQPCRLELKKGFEQKNISDFEGLLERSTTSGKYWDNFQTNTDDWDQVSDKYRFVSSFCLSLKKDRFQQVGWFRKSFIFYGFEDTELGWRLAKHNAKFHLLQGIIVLHQFHKSDRRRGWSFWRSRNSTLRKSARIFYHHTLDDDVYRRFYVFLGHFFILRYLASSVPRLPKTLYWFVEFAYRHITFRQLLKILGSILITKIVHELLLRGAYRLRNIISIFFIKLYCLGLAFVRQTRNRIIGVYLHSSGYFKSKK